MVLKLLVLFYFSPILNFKVFYLDIEVFSEYVYSTLTISSNFLIKFGGNKSGAWHVICFKDSLVINQLEKGRKENEKNN